MNFLSGVELYYSPSFDESNQITLTGDEFKHFVKVMRHSVGDEIYTTNGKGEIFLSIINEIKKDFLTASIKKTLHYENEFAHITFCVPKLKSSDRFEFALEKCTELGITNFLIFDSERTIYKSDKKKRWEKILIAAMKQSLRSYLPDLNTVSSVNDILKFPGRKILFEQTAESPISSLRISNLEKNYFIFGPEGGFTKDEMELFDEQYQLAKNRLRTETAIIKCASSILE